MKDIVTEVFSLMEKGYIKNINIEIPETKYDKNGKLIEGIDIKKIQMLPATNEKIKEIKKDIHQGYYPRLPIKTEFNAKRINLFFKFQNENFKITLPVVKINALLKIQPYKEIKYLVSDTKLKGKQSKSALVFNDKQSLNLTNEYNKNFKSLIYKIVQKKLDTILEKNKVLHDILSNKIIIENKNSENINKILEQINLMRKEQKLYKEIRQQSKLKEDLERFKYVKTILKEKKHFNEEELDKIIQLNRYLYINANKGNLVRNKEGKFIAIKDQEGKEIPLKKVRNKARGYNQFADYKEEHRTNDEIISDLTKYGEVIILLEPEEISNVGWCLYSYERKSSQVKIKKGIVFKPEYKEGKLIINYPQEKTELNLNSN